LKIDRSFVSQISQEGANAEIVRTIISLARNLGLKVVAEGIETEHQLTALRELGCERGKGFLFAKPMLINDLIEFLDQGGKPIPSTPGIKDISVVSTLQ
jgi:EAL domain-containing protein (putative c-di-GMP-specific phosphodiesterase class I)